MVRQAGAEDNRSNNNNNNNNDDDTDDDRNQAEGGDGVWTVSARLTPKRHEFKAVLHLADGTVLWQPTQGNSSVDLSMFPATPGGGVRVELPDWNDARVDTRPFAAVRAPPSPRHLALRTATPLFPSPRCFQLAALRIPLYRRQPDCEAGRLLESF